MAKMEYVRITEDNNKRFGTAVINDFGQKKGDQKLYFNNPKTGKRDVKLWDVETSDAQSYKKGGVIEIISEAEYKRMDETEVVDNKPAEEKPKAGKDKDKATATE